MSGWEDERSRAYRDKIDRLAEKAGLKPFNYDGRDHVEIPVWGSWADRVQHVVSSAKIWRDPAELAQWRREADIYSGTRLEEYQPKGPQSLAELRGEAPVERCGDYWPHVRMFAHFEESNRLGRCDREGLEREGNGCIPFVASEIHPDRPLVVITWPGDLATSYLQGHQDEIDTTNDAVAGMVHEIWVRSGAGAEEDRADVVVLHGLSSALLPGGGQDAETDSPYWRRLKEQLDTAMATGSIAWARDWEATANWLVTELKATQRPSVYLTGSYAGVDEGPNALLGEALERAGATVELCDNVMANRGSYEDPRWEPAGGAAPASSSPSM